MATLTEMTQCNVHCSQCYTGDVQKALADWNTVFTQRTALLEWFTIFRQVEKPEYTTSIELGDLVRWSPPLSTKSHCAVGIGGTKISQSGFDISGLSAAGLAELRELFELNSLVRSGKATSQQKIRASQLQNKLIPRLPHTANVVELKLLAQLYGGYMVLRPKKSEFISHDKSTSPIASWLR